VLNHAEGFLAEKHKNSNVTFYNFLPYIEKASPLLFPSIIKTVIISLLIVLVL